jgi:hypothetical protein
MLYFHARDIPTHLSTAIAMSGYFPGVYPKKKFKNDILCRLTIWDREIFAATRKAMP